MRIFFDKMLSSSRNCENNASRSVKLQQDPNIMRLARWESIHLVLGHRAELIIINWASFGDAHANYLCIVFIKCIADSYIYPEHDDIPGRSTH